MCVSLYNILHPSLILIMLTCNISFNSMYFQAEWKIVWILIRWFRQKVVDLGLQFFFFGKWIYQGLQDSGQAIRYQQYNQSFKRTKSVLISGLNTIKCQFTMYEGNI